MSVFLYVAGVALGADLEYKNIQNLLEFYIIVSLLPNYYILNIIEYIFIMKFVFGIINIYLDSNSCKKNTKDK